MKFLDYWRAMNDQTFQKANLTVSELRKVQETIASLQKRGLPSSKIINALQRTFKGLSEPYKASRAFWTETKRMDTEKVGEAAENLDIDTFKVILSPNACQLCQKKTNNGSKIFKTSDVNKSGYGNVPPFHPSCFCVLIPE